MSLDRPQRRQEAGPAQRVEASLTSADLELLDQLRTLNLESEEALHQFKQRVRQDALEHYQPSFQESLKHPILRPVLKRILSGASSRFRQLVTIELKRRYDDITGLLCEECFLSQAEAAAREEQPFSYIRLDVNRFKRVNDKWGHQTGNEYLRLVADCIIEAMEGVDGGLPGRKGGDEFDIVLKGATREEAEAVADRIKALLRERTLLVLKPGQKEKEALPLYQLIISEQEAEGKEGLEDVDLVSAGIFSAVPSAEHTFEEFERLADLDVHNDKSRFYAQSQLGRRGAAQPA